ncbi:MAG: hypothetical protein JWP09_634 [Candidatus Taylorbacteria bacterium]|nr:hypothetical protein [Candidatus Taylorbacteria bacterium]
MSSPEEIEKPITREQLKQQYGLILNELGALSQFIVNCRETVTQYSQLDSNEISDKEIEYIHELAQALKSSKADVQELSRIVLDLEVKMSLLDSSLAG